MSCLCLFVREEEGIKEEEETRGGEEGEKKKSG